MPKCKICEGSGDHCNSFLCVSACAACNGSGIKPNLGRSYKSEAIDELEYLINRWGSFYPSKQAKEHAVALEHVLELVKKI